MGGCLAAGILCGFVASAPAAGKTTLIWDSEGIPRSAYPVDSVGKGGSGVVTDADGTWISYTLEAAFRDACLEMKAGGRTLWRLEFGAAPGTELVAGSYSKASGFGSDSGPYLDISYEGRACGTGAVANFSVIEIRHDVYGNPVRLAASFEQRCRPGEPALIGVIDYSFDGTLGPTTFADGNLLVMYTSRQSFGAGQLYEFTPEGAELHVLPLARPTGGPPGPARLSRSHDQVQDVVLDASGRVHVFIGHERPWLGSFDPATGAWRFSRFAEWSVAMSATYGALAAFGDFVYATDGAVASDASGIVRFDASAPGAAQRFAEGSRYRDLAAGFDGRLYALSEVCPDQVDIYDPAALTLLDSIVLSRRVAGIAVDKNGEIFAASFEGGIYHFDPAGGERNRLDTGVLGTFDIDLSRSGRIVVGRSHHSEPGARVIVTDVSLSSFSLIDPGAGETADRQTFVGWVEPPPSTELQPAASNPAVR